MIHTMRAGAEYVYMEDMIIAEYEEGGASFGYARQQKDSLQIARKYGGAKAYYFVCLKRKIGEMIGHERA